MFHCHPLLKHMQELTGMNIEKMAVMELIFYLEHQVDEIAKQSVEELQQLNKLRKIQGLYQKNRIDRTCISQAIKHLCKEVPPQQEHTKKKKGEI
jgi:hypothetical protein